MTGCQNCIYSSNAPWYQQTFEVAVVTVAIGVGAAFINTVASFLYGRDDLYPAFVGGGAIATSTAGLHFIGHVMDDGKVNTHPDHQPTDLQVVVELSLLILFTTALMKYGLKHFDCKLTRWEFAGLEGLSFGGAVLTSNVVIQEDKEP